MLDLPGERRRGANICGDEHPQGRRVGCGRRLAAVPDLKRSDWMLPAGGVAAAVLIIGWVNNARHSFRESQAQASEVHDPCWHGTANLAKCREAAEAGDARAEFQYGLILWGGHDLTLDHKAALDWFRRSARQGYEPAQEALGRLLSDKAGGWPYGLYHPYELEAKLINPVEAYAWLVAAGESEESASLKAELTPTQMEEAERLATEYSAKYPPPVGTPAQQAALLRVLQTCHSAPGNPPCRLEQDLGAIVGASRDDLLRSLGNPPRVSHWPCHPDRPGQYCQDKDNVGWEFYPSCKQGPSFATVLRVSFNPAGVVSHARWKTCGAICTGIVRCVP
jgi:hypothetical protein